MTNEEKNKVADEFRKGVSAAQTNTKRPHIILCGYTGTGKSSLAKAILGNVVPETAIGTGQPQTHGFKKYENNDVVLFDSQGFEAGQTEGEFLEFVSKFVREKQEDANVDNHIHLVWYTISLPGARVTPCDLSLIQKIFTTKNTIVVLTKRDAARKNQIDAMRKTLIESGIPSEQIIEVTDEESGSIGCNELMELSLKMLPEAYKDAFLCAQRINTEKKVEAIKAKSKRAKTIIATGVITAASAGAIPVPGSDAPIIISAQMGMIGGLSYLYGFEGAHIKHQALPFVLKIVGMTTASQLTKLIPGLGSVINATVAGTLTGALGMYCKSEFERMAIQRAKGEEVTFPEFDFKDFKRVFEKYKKEKQDLEIA